MARYMCIEGLEVSPSIADVSEIHNKADLSP